MPMFQLFYHIVLVIAFFITSAIKWNLLGLFSGELDSNPSLNIPLFLASGIEVDNIDIWIELLGLLDVCSD